MPAANKIQYDSLVYSAFLQSESKMCFISVSKTQTKINDPLIRTSTCKIYDATATKTSRILHINEQKR